MVDMASLSQWLQQVARWQYFWLCLFVMVTLSLHVSVINRPTELILDEQHYVKDARVILSGLPTERPEHPPVGKLVVALGIKLFGDRPVGWRSFSILFGTASVALFWLICRRLGMPPVAVNLSAFLFTLENLSFVQANVAMLDVFMLTFLLASFWLYLRGQFQLCAVMIALSALAKLSGGLAVPAIGLHWLVTGRKRPEIFLPSMLLAFLLFMGLMPLFDYFAFHSWMNPIDRVQSMLSLSGSLTFTSAPSESARRPWEWVVLPVVMAYWYTPSYMGAVSFTLWALILPAVVYMGFRAFKRENAALFGLAWFAGTYLSWIPGDLLTDRVTFIFYFYPTLGAICIGVGAGLYHLLCARHSLRQGRMAKHIVIAVTVFLVAHVAVFCVLSPVFT